jgi:hypothetical protein
MAILPKLNRILNIQIIGFPFNIFGFDVERYGVILAGRAKSPDEDGQEDGDNGDAQSNEQIEEIVGVGEGFAGVMCRVIFAVV